VSCVSGSAVNSPIMQTGMPVPSMHSIMPRAAPLFSVSKPMMKPASTIMPAP